MFESVAHLKVYWMRVQRTIVCVDRLGYESASGSPVPPIGRGNWRHRLLSHSTLSGDPRKRSAARHPNEHLTALPHVTRRFSIEAQNRLIWASEQS